MILKSSLFFVIEVSFTLNQEPMLEVKSLRSEPFLWIHLSGIVMFPVCLGIMWIALGLGNTFNPFVELSILALIGILSILLMQLTRPFNIFSILLVSLRAESLNDQQKKILVLFKTFKNSLVSLLASSVMVVTLWLIYCLSPLSVGAINFVPQWRILSIAIACVAFWASNLFLQVPLSVLLVLLTKQAKLAKIKPYAVDKIEQDFTTPGIKVSKILWFLESPLEITEKV